MRQAGGIGEAGPPEAQPLGLAVHALDELRFRPRHRLGQRDAGVVAGVHDQAAQQRVDTYPAARLEKAARARRAPGALRDLHRLFARQPPFAQVAKGQVGGHQLGERGGLEARLGLALGEHLVAGQIEEHERPGRDGRRLRRTRQRLRHAKGRGRRDQEGAHAGLDAQRAARGAPPGTTCSTRTRALPAAT